jgi:hypothetical protein
MLTTLLSFSRTPIACKWKFNVIYKQYKDDKIVNGISINDCHESPFYDALDSWWHRSENVKKHVNVFVNEIDEIVGSLNFQIDFDNGSKDDVKKESLNKLTPNEVTKQEA